MIIEQITIAIVMFRYFFYLPVNKMDKIKLQMYWTHKKM